MFRMDALMDAKTEAALRRQVHREALPPEPPAHLVAQWRDVVARLMAGEAGAEAEAERLRCEERAWWKANNEGGAC